MNMLPNHIKNLDINYAKAGLTRKRFNIEERDDNYIVINNQKIINFASNDYLSIANDYRVKQAFIEGINKFGFGSSSSSLVSGYYNPHMQLEREFASFLGCEQSILFNSGYHANLGVINTLANRHSIILSDKLIHASMLDGILLSKAKNYRFKHNDINNINDLASKASKEFMLVTESIFSINGDISPIPEISKIVKNHNSKLIIDDAHGIGILGNRGRGIIEHFNLNRNDFYCLITPLGKAFGSIGALVSGSNEVIESLVKYARTYRYTTALPPATALGIIAILRIIRDENFRREKLNHLIKFFIKQANDRNIILSANDLTPIKSIPIKSSKQTVHIQQKLLEKGFLVACIRPPTVPIGENKIKISLNYNHNENQILQMLDLISEFHEDV